MISLRDLPVTLRALFSSFLIVIGIGYLTALSYLFLVDVEPHREAGHELVEGISAKYHGSTSGTRLEAALTGTRKSSPFSRKSAESATVLSLASRFRLSPASKTYRRSPERIRD